MVCNGAFQNGRKRKRSVNIGQIILQDIESGRANKSFRLNSFSHREVNNWNNLASDVVCADSINSFKARFDKAWKSKRFDTTEIYYVIYI